MLRPSTLCTLLRLPPRAWQLPVLLLAAFMIAACDSTPKIKGVPSNLPDIPLYGSSSTPPHHMSKGEYPFDSNGTYVTSWVAQSKQLSSSYASSHAEESLPEAGPGASRANPSKVESLPPAAPSRVENAPPAIKSSYSAASGRKTSDEPAPRKGGAAKPSVTTKSKSGSTTASKKVAAAPKKKTSSGGTSKKHVVKSTDTLSGIAKKYGTTEKKLKAANGLKSDLIRDGRALVIPK